MQMCNLIGYDNVLFHVKFYEPLTSSGTHINLGCFTSIELWSHYQQNVLEVLNVKELMVPVSVIVFQCQFEHTHHSSQLPKASVVLW